MHIPIEINVTVNLSTVLVVVFLAVATTAFLVWFVNLPKRKARRIIRLVKAIPTRRKSELAGAVAPRWPTASPLVGPAPPMIE